MLILVLGNHTSQTRLDVVKALKDAGAHAGQAVNQYQDMDFRRLNVDHLDWKHPEPSAFDEDAYDALYLEREDKHDAWVLSDPRMLFYIEDFLGLAKSHRGKSRIVVVRSDTDDIAADIVRLHGLSKADARRVAEAHEGALDKWCEETRRRFLEIDEVNDEALEDLFDYVEVEEPPTW